ncbi:hypothetical protein DMA12_04910 [Amycolatopsis balhimycina DSM 5908]|uniref:Uncharacterized protein n=1 Tax=Amycolatopsis balhimycina DSM 5908 TaxID=1081091 RepID=A0A428X167_AMYBA|nr:hypothetical protein [Amycolatopsis balhimycina]RSM49059.1 hypothetical protein DMA12_04910 [Amycolatopsis balhimycina DSM 5908]
MTTTRHPGTSTNVLVAAWTVPVMVAGQFALLAGLPIAVVLIGALRERRLRWWAGALTALYVVLLTLWLSGPGSAPSLSKYLSPVATALFAVAGIAVAIAAVVSRRRAR